MKDTKDRILIEAIADLDGHELIVHLKNGEIKKVWNITRGYDEGDDYAHITTNISPFINGTSIDVFFSDDITRIIKKENNETIYKI